MAKSKLTNLLRSFRPFKNIQDFRGRAKFLEKSHTYGVDLNSKINVPGTGFGSGKYSGEVLVVEVKEKKGWETALSMDAGASVSFNRKYFKGYEHK